MKPAAYVTTFSLIATITVLSPGMAAETDVNADAVQCHQADRTFTPIAKFALSSEQMDAVHAGLTAGTTMLGQMLNACSNEACVYEQIVRYTEAIRNGGFGP